MKIETGYTGEPHITSNDDQARNQGIFGTGNYILDVGNKLNAVLTNATTVTLEDGDGMLQGVHFRIDPGITEAVAISPGTTGYNRIDLICARYTKEAGTGVEDVSLVVIEGTPSSSTPSVPSYTAGDVLAGDALAEFPLWKVTITGLTPALTRIAEIVKGAAVFTEYVEKAVTLYSSDSASDTISMSGSGSEYSGSKTVSIGTLPAGSYMIAVGFGVGGSTYGVTSGVNILSGGTTIAIASEILAATAYVTCIAFVTLSAATAITARLGCEAQSSGNKTITRWSKVLKLG